MHNALIVDNDITLVELMQTILRRNGYQTIVTSRSEESLDMIYHHRPDVIILNDQMPHVSGSELCSCIKQNPDLGATPVIMVSAGDRVRDPVYLRQIGADAVLPKPYRPADLLRLLDGLLPSEQAGGYTG